MTRRRVCISPPSREGETHVREVAASFAKKLYETFGVRPETELTPDDRFLISAIVGSAAIVNADGKVVEAELSFVHDVLLQALAVSDLRDTTVAQVRAAAVESLPEWPEILSVTTCGLSTSSRRVLIELLVDAAVSDGEIAEQERSVLQRVAAVMDVGPELVDAALDAARAVGAHRLRWPDGLEPASLYDVSPRLRAALVRTFGLASRTTPTTNLPTHSDEDELPSSLLHQAIAHRRYLAQVCERGISSLEDLIEAAALVSARRLIEDERRAPLRVLVVGEFSNGKSTFVNALLGREVLPSAAIPCSATVVRVRAGATLRYLVAEGGAEREVAREEFERLAMLTEDEANEFSLDSGANRPELVVEVDAALPPGIELVDLPGLYEHVGRTSVVTAYLDMADAVILVLNAMRPLGEAERATIDTLLHRLSPDGKSSDALFAVFNFADLLRTPADRGQVVRRARSFFGEKISSEDRVWLVSSLGALDESATRLAASGEPTWREQFDAMARVVGEFLVTGPEKGRIERMRASVLNALDVMKGALEHRLAALVGEGASLELDISRRSEEAKRARRALESMLASVEDSKTRCTYTASRRFEEELERAANALLSASDAWRSDHNIVFSSQAVAKDYEAQARAYLVRRLREFEETTLREVIEGELRELCRKLDLHAVELERALSAADTDITEGTLDVSGALAQEGAFGRVLKAAGGWLADGPVATFVEGNLSWRGISSSLAVALGSRWVLLFFGLPLGPATVAAMGAASLVWLVRGDTVKARRKLAAKVAKRECSRTRKIAAQSVAQLRDGLHQFFDVIRASINEEIGARLRLTERELELLQEQAGQVQRSAELLRPRLEAAKAELERLQRELEAWTPGW